MEVIQFLTDFPKQVELNCLAKLLWYLKWSEVQRKDLLTMWGKMTVWRNQVLDSLQLSVHQHSDTLLYSAHLLRQMEYFSPLTRRSRSSRVNRFTKWNLNLGLRRFPLLLEIYESNKDLKIYIDQISLHHSLFRHTKYNIWKQEYYGHDILAGTCYICPFC